VLYSITEDNARAVIGQYLLTIIPRNHLKNVVIYKSNVPQISIFFIGSINHLGTWDVGKTLEKPSARDLQSLLVFFQHPAWFIEPINHRNEWYIA